MSQPFENRAGWETQQFGLPPGNPYSAPQNAFADDVGLKPTGPFPNQPRRRPGSVTAICIIAIILGAMGGLTALSSIANGLMGGKMQTMFTPPAQPGAPKAMQEAQAKMQSDLAAVTGRYALVNIAIGVAHLGLIVALIWASVRTLALSDRGRKALQLTMLAAIIFEIGRAIPTTAVQLETLPVIESSMDKMMRAAVPPGKQLSQQEEATLKMMPQIMKGAVWVGISVVMVWVLIKIIFYGVSTRLLGRPSVRAVYEASDPVVIASAAGPMPGAFPGAPA